MKICKMKCCCCWGFLFALTRKLIGNMYENHANFLYDRQYVPHFIFYMMHVWHLTLYYYYVFYVVEYVKKSHRQENVTFVVCRYIYMKFYKSCGELTECSFRPFRFWMLNLVPLKLYFLTHSSFLHNLIKRRKDENDKGMIMSTTILFWLWISNILYILFFFNVLY